MLNRLRTLFSPETRGSAPAVPDGRRIYAVGDVHGRLDLFEAIIAAIEADDASRGPSRTSEVILLGDLIDRGSDSAGVIAAAREWSQRSKVRILLGNHEEMFLKAFDSEEVLRSFLRWGGRETVLSYVAEPGEYHRADLARTRELMKASVPAEDLDFIGSFEDSISIGDYLFVHAGVDPETPLAEQKVSDLRWIREPFLSHTGDLGAVVVHGHTITEQPQVRPNRIGIDTGAYDSGRLTALGLEGSTRWFIEVKDADGTITAATRSA
ncbi:MAG: metallophosphoesterase family protein [Novosphingobium sp.]